MPAPSTAEAIRDVNTRYHDAAAEHYDTKWGVDYGDIGRNQVRGKLHKLLGKPLPTFGRSLEIGAGTGYFTLNMLQDGVVREADRDRHLARHARRHAGQRASGSASTSRPSPATPRTLPFADDAFDLVLGHAVLHHIPHLDRAFAEFQRVLRPGGEFLFAGEPSQTGDRIAAYPKRAALRHRAAVAQAHARAPGGGLRHAPGRPRRVAAAARRPRRRVARAVRRRARVHARRARRLGARRGLRRRRASAARSCWRTGSAG